MGSEQSNPGEGTPTGTLELRRVVSVKDFGAIGNGASHPLSESFATLGEAQAVYPNATSLNDEVDGLAIQLADASGYPLFPGGTYLINDLTLTNPPIFLSHVAFIVENGAAKGLTFQGDSFGDQEVQGGFFIDGQSNATACELLTIQGRNWVIPKVRIRGGGRGNGDIGLRFTNYAADNAACAHNHIGFLMVSGVTDAVKWDCDDKKFVRRGYASNNVIEHVFLIQCTNVWHYNYTATDRSAQYFRNRLHHGYFESSDVGFKFTGNATAGNVVGVQHDWWAVSFDNITTEFDTDYLLPSGTLHNLGYGPLNISETNGGRIRHIVQFQRQGPNQYARFAGTIAEDPGNGIDELGHQVRISSISSGWQRGFYFTDGSVSPPVKKMALGADGTGSTWLHAWLGDAYNSWALRIDLSDLGLQLGDRGNELAFFGGTPTTKPTVTGSRGGNAALGSLLAALASLGLITDNSSP